MKHSISYTALLVSAALAVSTSAYAQTVAPPPFQNDGTYVPQGGTHDPLGADIAAIQIPGWTAAASTGSYLLKDGNGNVIATTVAGAVNSAGVPLVTTYASEGAAYTAASGTGGNAGKVLVDATGALVACGASCGGVAPAGDHWTTNIDDPTKTYHWSSATYANSAAVVGGTAYIGTAANGIATDVIVDKNGNPVSITAANAAGLTGTTGGAATTAILASNSWTAKSQGSALPTTSLLPTADWAFNSASANGGTVNWKPNQGSQTTNLAGATIYGNSKGQYQASGPGGTVISDPAIGGLVATAGGLVVTDKNGNQTTVAADSISVVGPNGYVKIADPSVVVSNGTVAGTTSIVNGTVNAGTSITAPTVNATTVNATTVKATTVNAGTVNAGTTNTTNLNVATGGSIDMGDNRVQNVAAPTAPMDAANKAYVDQGYNALTATLNSDYKKLGGGIAAATALANPDRTGNQTWAIAVSEGFWDGYSATAVNGIVSLGNIAGGYDFSVGGGVAITDRGAVSGRVTGQIAGGGGYVPLK